MIAVLKYTKWGILIFCLVCIAVDHNKYREMKKENVRLSIELLNLQIEEMRKRP